MSCSIKIEVTFGERCDKCDKIDLTRPMVVLKSRCRETGLSLTWVHLDEFEKEFARAKRMFQRAEGTRETKP